MKTFTTAEISWARAAANEISERIAAIGAADHPLEREQQIDLLRAYIAPQPGHSLPALAQEILDARIASTKEAFLGATKPFYLAADVAGRAADECQAVIDLHHRRNSLGDSPSLEVAQRLLETFRDFLSTPAAASAASETANEQISESEKSPTGTSGATAAAAHVHEEKQA